MRPAKLIQRQAGHPRVFFHAALVLTGAALVCSRSLAAPEEAPSSAKGAVYALELDNQIISPITQEYVLEGIRRAENAGAACVLITLDTPGGLLESTRRIVKGIMNAEVPVVVYVAPSGSRAGSAGVFITLAAHVAAMAPSTNIGAAHPVSVGSGRVADTGVVPKIVEFLFGSEEEEEKKEEPARGDAPAESSDDDEDPMEDKILNDTVAWIAAIAKERGRNEEWAKQAVTESVSATASEALELNVIDLIAASRRELLNAIDGRSVRLAGETRALQTASAEVVELGMTKRQQLLAHVTNPNVAYILMMLGTFGLIFEFTHPGIGFPGIAGAICLLLAFYAFQTLPVNLVAIALIFLGIVLLVAEVLVISHGLLALGALVALTLGSLMLFESPDPNLRVSLAVVWPTIALLGGIFFLAVRAVVRARGNRVATGEEALIGVTAKVVRDLNPEGKIFVHGEYWNARSSKPALKGSRVRIVGLDGLTAVVEPVSDK